MKNLILISFLFIAAFANAQQIPGRPQVYANRVWKQSVHTPGFIIIDSGTTIIHFADDTLKVYYFQYKFPDFSMWAEMVAKCYHRPAEKECEDYMLSLDKKYKTCKARNLIELKGVKPEGVSDIIPTKK